MRFHGLSEKINYRKMAPALVGVFLISLLPILYCSFFDYATGDDLWEGAAAHRVLVNGGTVREFIMAVYEWAKGDYLGWEGNWFSIILWCLEPSIWGEKVYCITPWISILFLCGGTCYFLRYFLRKHLGCNRSVWIIISVLVCFFSVQYMPYIRGGIFWYTGMINYVVPYGLCLASFVWTDRYFESGRKRYLIFTAVFFSCLGGMGYIPIVLAFEILLMMIIYNMCSHKREKVIRAFWMLIPLALLTAGFIFSALSPGNAVRGGESYHFSVARVLTTVLESVGQGFFGAWGWFLSVRPLILVVPLSVIMLWEQTDISRVRCNFDHPVWAILILFLISCSVYAPGIYAESEVSGGVPDTIYFIFLLTLMMGIIYLTCCIKKAAIERGWRVPDRKWTGRLRIIIILGETLFCIIAGKYLIGNMTGYICFDFIRSGQLRDFEYQMQERLAVLQNPEITDVVLPEMNNEQGPFMHMALMPDPNAYTNQATARFYGKESVTAIPREEYYELYGRPGEITDDNH